MFQVDLIHKYKKEKSKQTDGNGKNISYVVRLEIVLLEILCRRNSEKIFLESFRIGTTM